LHALVPKPRVNVTRFHGVFAPNSAHRAQVKPAKRGKGNKAHTADAPEETTPAERRAAMTWAQRLKRVFNIDVESCNSCGGPVKIIACIEDPVVIEKILTHLDRKAACGAALGQLVRLIDVQSRESSQRRRRHRRAAGSLSSRAWKPSKNRAGVQKFVSAQRRNLGQHCVEAQVDDGLMTWRYSMGLRIRALIRPIPATRVRSPIEFGPRPW